MSEVKPNEGVGELVPYPVAREAKPGYKTTELYLALGLILTIVLDIIPAPASKEGLYAAIIGAAYALARGLAKLGVPETVEVGGGDGDLEHNLPGGITPEQRAAL